MRLQLLSDLHLETETYAPEPAEDAELLVLAGDIDSEWLALDRFAGWPVPVVFVAGNHEFDGRDVDAASVALRERCTALGITMLEREHRLFIDGAGRRIRIVGTTRWADFDLFGALGRARAMRAGAYFMELMQSTRHGRPFDVDAMRDEALVCRDWLAGGAKSGTASFCNADDELLPCADLWLHGHLHCVHDYRVAHAGGATRVVCNSRGHTRRGEGVGHQPRLVLEV
jgi:hypothetical protein